MKTRNPQNKSEKQISAVKIIGKSFKFTRKKLLRDCSFLLSALNTKKNMKKDSKYFLKKCSKYCQEIQ